MDNIIPYKDKAPKIHESAYIDMCSKIIGDVSIGENCSVWPDAILRGDSDKIIVERDVVILDKAFLEAPKGFPVSVDEGGLISHCAALHGCQVERDVLIGIGCIVLEGARIGEESIVGAGTVVTPNKEIPPRSFVLGVPGNVLRKVTDEEIERVRREHEEAQKKAEEYIEMNERRKATMIRELERLVRERELPKFSGISFSEE